MRLAVAMALVLVTGLWSAGPVGAAGEQITLSAQVSTTTPDRVVLSGRVAGRARSVEVQARQGGHWVNVRKAKIDSRRHFRVIVPAAEGLHQYRVVAARKHSPERAVQVVSPTSGATAQTVTNLTSNGGGSRPSDACGPRPVKPDGSLWSCTFADDFSGTQLDRSRWTVATHYATGTAAAYACAIDDPSVVSVSGGALNLSVRRVDPAVPCDVVTQGGSTPYVAGTVSTAQSFSQQYGRFEARILDTATDAVPGLHEAFWLWPVDQGGAAWPASGEIDVSETYSIYPHNSYPRLHSASDTAVDGVNTAWNCAAERGVWNTYALEWSPTRMEFFVNGRSCLLTTSVDPVFQKAYIPILTQALGGTYNEYDGRAPLPATMSVDYLRVWK